MSKGPNKKQPKGRSPAPKHGQWAKLLETDHGRKHLCEALRSKEGLSRAERRVVGLAAWDQGHGTVALLSLAPILRSWNVGGHETSVDNDVDRAACNLSHWFWSQRVFETHRDENLEGPSRFDEMFAAYKLERYLQKSRDNAWSLGAPSTSEANPDDTEDSATLRLGHLVTWLLAAAWMDGDPERLGRAEWLLEHTAPPSSAHSFVQRSLLKLAQLLNQRSHSSLSTAEGVLMALSSFWTAHYCCIPAVNNEAETVLDAARLFAEITLSHMHAKGLLDKTAAQRLLTIAEIENQEIWTLVKAGWPGSRPLLAPSYAQMLPPEAGIRLEFYETCASLRLADDPGFCDFLLSDNHKLIVCVRRAWLLGVPLSQVDTARLRDVLAARSLTADAIGVAASAWEQHAVVRLAWASATLLGIAVHSGLPPDCLKLLEADLDATLAIRSPVADGSASAATTAVRRHVLGTLAKYAFKNLPVNDAVDSDLICHTMEELSTAMLVVGSVALGNDGPGCLRARARALAARCASALQVVAVVKSAVEVTELSSSFLESARMKKAVSAHSKTLVASGKARGHFLPELDGLMAAACDSLRCLAAANHCGSQANDFGAAARVAAEATGQFEAAARLFEAVVTSKPFVAAHGGRYKDELKQDEIGMLQFMLETTMGVYLDAHRGGPKPAPYRPHQDLSKAVFTEFIASLTAPALTNQHLPIGKANAYRALGISPEQGLDVIKRTIFARMKQPGADLAAVQDIQRELTNGPRRLVQAYLWGPSQYGTLPPASGAAFETRGGHNHLTRTQTLTSEQVTLA